MNDELTLIVPIHAKTECRERVRGLLLDLAARTRQEAGNSCYALHEVRDDPDQFIIYERWRGQSALDFHMGQTYLVDFLAREEELLSKPIRGMYCRLLAG